MPLDVTPSMTPKTAFHMEVTPNLTALRGSPTLGTQVTEQRDTASGETRMEVRRGVVPVRVVPLQKRAGELYNVS